MSAFLAGFVEGPEGAFAGVCWSGLLSGAGRLACPKETKMAAKNAIVPQVSLSVKVGMVVMRLWLMQGALKQEADQPCCLVSQSKTADFEPPQAERAAAIKSRTL